MSKGLPNKPLISPKDKSYPERNGDEYYLNNNDNELLLVMRDDEPIYAEDRHGNQIYPEVNGEQLFIETSKGPIYAKNALKQEIYPKDKYKNDKPIFTQSDVLYTKDKDGNEFYPKLADGTEMLYERFAYTGTGAIKYPIDKNKRPQYDIDPITDDEKYHIDPKTGMLVIGKDGDGNQVYAKKGNGDEFYPAKGIHAETKDGLPVYAISNEGEIIFPTDVEGNEEYLRDNKDFDIIYSAKELLPRYAKDKNGNEIYPIQEIISDSGTSMEVIIRKKYAIWNNRPYYPLDAYGNEYIIHKKDANGNLNEKESFPLSYPITNDKWVIVPNVNKKPHILKNGIPPLTHKNVIGKLFRDRLGYHDFITNVLSIRNSRSTKRMYKILPTGSSMPMIRNKPFPVINQPVVNIHKPNTGINQPVVNSNKPVSNAINPPNLPETPPKERSWLFIMLVIFLIIIGFICLFPFIIKT